MDYTYEINGVQRTVKIDKGVDSLQAILDENTSTVEVIPSGNGCVILRIDEKNHTVRYARDDDGLHMMISGWAFTSVEPGADAGLGARDAIDIIDGKQILVAPMPGQVVKVNVKVGDKVTRKQCLIIVEAMKMENELNTAIDGVVTAVHVAAGQQVGALQPLVEVTQNPE